MMSPEEIAEARRLFFAEKWKIGTIATHLGRHPDAVTRAIEEGNFVRQGLFRGGKGEAYIGFIEETLKLYPQLTATRVHEMIVARGYKGSVRLTRHLVQHLRPFSKAEAFLRLKTLIGEQGQVDWANFGQVQIGHARRLLSVFMMVLSWCRAIFAWFTLDQKLDTFLRCHLDAFAYFKGCPRILLYDNLKSAVIERCGNAIHFNSRLLELASHYHFEPRPVAVARGNEKGRVERAIRFLRQRFFAARTFRDVDDLNQQFSLWREEWGHARPCPEDNSMSVAQALNKEREVLLPLPVPAFCVETPQPVRSGKTPYIRFDLNDYSIPYQLVKKPLTLIATEREIRIINCQETVALHPRSYDKLATIEDERHIAELVEFKRAARQSGGITRLFASVPEAKLFLERVVEHSLDLASATRHLERLLNDYGASELTAAIDYANHRELTAPSAIAQFLEQERRRTHTAPPLNIVITDDPRVRHLRVIPHNLETYHGLATSDFDDE